MGYNCENLHSLFNRLRRFHFPFNDDEIPMNGIYVLFEKGELGHGADRIVRVGTHTGENQLRSRLKQHFLMENKDRSIFRKNIGRAILNSRNDDFLKFWEIDLTTREAKDRHVGDIDQDRQKEIEKEITEYIQNNFSFVVLGIEDKDERLLMESKIISSVSLCKDCAASGAWLGNSSPKDKIVRSGLWLVNELWKDPLGEDDFERLKSLIS